MGYNNFELEPEPIESEIFDLRRPYQIDRFDLYEGSREFPAHNIANPEDFAQFAQEVKQSGGKSLIVTHPLFNMPAEQVPSLDDITDPKFKASLQHMANVATGFTENEIPVLMQHHIPEDNPRLYEAYQNLAEAKAGNLGFPVQKIHWIFTASNSPTPVMNNPKGYFIWANDHEKDSAFANRLKEAGVEIAYIAGQNLGGWQGGLLSESYEAAEPGKDPIVDHFKTHSGENHPGSLLRLYGCVSRTIEILVDHSEIKVIPTTATYPDTLPRQNQMEKVVTSGRTIFRIKRD